jgi:GntR family transcriptional regulator
MDRVVIHLRLDAGSGVAPYQQIVRQIRQAVRLGALRVGDQLPTVKEVVEQLAINPNTVLKAYRALEHDGLCEGRPGVGTFVVDDLPGPSPQVQARLRAELERWVEQANEAGLDVEAMVGLVRSAASVRSSGAVA